MISIFQSLWRDKMLWAPSALFFLTAAIFTLFFHYPAPYFDHWSIVPLYEAHLNGSLRTESLFELHGGHWHASAYVVLLVLSELSHMNHLVEAAASVAIAAVGFWALLLILRRTVDAFSVSGTFAPALAFISFFYFSLDQAANWLWTWQIAVFITVAGVLWSIEALSRSAHLIRNTLLAMLTASIAIFSFAVAWAVLPVGFYLILTRTNRFEIRNLISLGLWSALSIILIWFAAAAYGENSSATDFRLNIFGSIFYVINYLASPLTRFTDNIAIPVLFGSLVALFILIRKSPLSLLSVSQKGRGLIAIAAFAVGAGLLTSFGRSDAIAAGQPAADPFTARYISFSNLFWVAGLSLFVIAAIARAQSTSTNVLNRFTITAFVVICGLKIANTAHVANDRVGFWIDTNKAAANIRASYPEINDSDAALISASDQDITEGIEILYRRHASFFRRDAQTERETQK